MTLTEAKAKVEAAGYQVSAASFEDEKTVYACSVEGLPGAFNHPRYEVQVIKRLGVVAVGGSAKPISETVPRVG